MLIVIQRLVVLGEDITIHAHKDREHDSNSHVRSRHSGGGVRHGHNHQNVKRHNASQSDRRNASYAQSNTYRSNGQKHYRRRYSHDDYVNSKSDVPCWYCGESNHVSKNCRHGDYILCNKCNEYGHKAKHCSF